VVTGASQGIGRAVAYRLACEGYVVWAVARRAERLEELAASGPVGRIRPLPLDLSTTPDFAVLLDAAAETGGQVDTVVHCAGIVTTGPVIAADPDEALRLMNLNALSPLRLTSRLRHRLGPGSTVVFVNSSQGLLASGGAGIYAASKHALKAIADALRSDLTGSGIRVTSIYPGRTATPMQARLYAERHEVYRPECLLQPEAIAQLVHTVITLPAGAEVTDISVRPALKGY
jgi:NADP-dependent 3-hydroxy acid dehydrogenase YdfG